MVDWIPKGADGFPETSRDAACRVVDWLISGAVYDAAPDGGPSELGQRNACEAAARLQAAAHAAGSIGGGPISIGSVSLPAVDTGATPAGVDVEAWRVLISAGLGWQVVG